MATGDILIFNYSNYVMIYYQKQRGRDVGVDGEVDQNLLLIDMQDGEDEVGQLKFPASSPHTG